jgi:hypothetical protein
MRPEQAGAPRFSNRFSPVGHQHCADPHCLECLKAERDPHPSGVRRLGRNIGFYKAREAALSPFPLVVETDEATSGFAPGDADYARPVLS